MSLRFKSLFRRMSKDHGGSSGHHGTKGSSSSAKEHLSNAKEPTTKGGKKASSSSSSSSSSCATSPDMQPLPTVKEEKRPPSSKLGIPVKRMENAKNKENASAAAVAASAPASTRVLAPPQPTQPPDTLVMPSHPPPPTGGAPATAVAATNTSSSLGSFPEKAQLEKTVSDLVKNAESKKQEIAALKIEINRLKVSYESNLFTFNDNIPIICFVL